MRRIVAVSVVVAAALAGLVPAPPSVRALPPGYSQTLIPGVGGLTTVRVLPNGAVAVLEKGGFGANGTGVVRIIRGGVLLPTPALSVAVCANSERGLLGIAADRNLGATGNVYLYYTRRVNPSVCVNRVSRFTMTNDVIDPASEVVLVDNIPSTGGNHNGGDVEIGNDGQLYIAVGDAGTDPRGDSGSAGANDAAQDLGLLNGKILRVDPATGTASAGNPFAASGVDCRASGSASLGQRCREIFAWGLRNPYRFAFDPNAEEVRFFINDVGQNTREEVNEGIWGANYGWPTREGPCPQGQNPPCAGPPPGLVDPLTSYRSGSITGGTFIPNGVGPADADGDYLFGDYISGQVYVYNGDGTIDYTAPFAQVPGLTDLDATIEGNSLVVYGVSNSAGQVYRFSAPGGGAPVSPSEPLRYVARAEPVRVLDSREPEYGAAPVAGTVVRTVPTGVDGSVTRAVLVNLTYVEPVSRGFLVAWPNGSPRPSTSNINADAGEIVANAAVVPVDASGAIAIYTNVAAHVVIDVLGSFVSAPGPVSAGRFVPLTPGRLADTRDPAGGDNQYTRRGTSPLDLVNVPVAGRRGVPASGVSAVTLTVTGLSDGIPGKGWVNVMAGGTPFRLTSNLNTNGGNDIRPNLVVVPLGPDGSIDVHMLTVADVVVDVTGYLTDDTAAPATRGRFRALPPFREVDTRVGYGFPRPPAFGLRSFDPRAIPSDAIGVSQNVTLVDNTAAGFVVSYPAEPRPVPASTANLDGASQVRAAAAFTPMTTPRVRYFFQPRTQAIIDVTGYFEG